MISNKTFMQIAYDIANESKAIKRKVGAIIVKDNNIIAVGYNGTPSGFDNSCEEECCKGVAGAGTYKNHLITRPEVLHAESNAIAKCARSVNSSEGADIYTTTCPCLECAKMIIQAGIKNVFYSEEYKSQDGLNLLVKAGIQVTQILDEGLQTILKIEIKNITEEQIKELSNKVDAVYSGMDLIKSSGFVESNGKTFTVEKEIKKEDLYFEDRNKEIERRMKELEDELCKNKKLASYYMQISNLSKSIDELTKGQG